MKRLRILRPVLFAALTGAALALNAAENSLALKATDPALAWGPCPAFFPEGCAIAVLHGDPGAPGADVFFRVPGNYDLPHHWHTSAERMVLVAGRLQVEYDGESAVLLEPGTYAWGPAGKPHKGRCVSDTACVLFIAFDGAVDAHPVSATP